MAAGAAASDTDQHSAWLAVAAEGDGRANAVHSVVARVADRAGSQLALREQLRALAEHELQPTADMLLVPQGQEMVKLARWEPAASEKRSDSMCFLATLAIDPGPKCEKGAMVAAVEVPADYPLRAPTFRLTFERCPAVTPTAADRGLPNENDSVNILKQIEAEVNAGYGMPEAADSGGLLCSQVSRLMCCFAVHAATLSAAATGRPTLFCSRPHRGRGRSHPFAHDTQLQQFA